MKVLVIVICIILILLAIYIVIRSVSQALKGKCCEGCSSCNLKEQCSANKQDKNK